MKIVFNLKWLVFLAVVGFLFFFYVYIMFSSPSDFLSFLGIPLYYLLFIALLLLLIGNLLLPPMEYEKTVKKYRKIMIGAIILVLVLIIFTFPIPQKKRVDGGPTYCFFQSGFTCLAWRLNTNGSFYLKIGQGTGKTINITGFGCTKKADLTEQGGTVVYTSGTGIVMQSGSMAYVADPSNSTLYITCTDEVGNILRGAVGDAYNGKLYINYTEVGSEVHRIVVGSIFAKYES